MSDDTLPISILIVEDDQDLALMMNAFLTDEGFAVQCIGDGQEAVQHLQSAQPTPDLMILDVMLPGMNGLEVIREVRDFYHKPVLMLTARDDDLTEITSLKRGADGYLVKPVRAHVLLAHIESAIRRAKAGDTSGSTTDGSQLAVQTLVLDEESMSVQLDGSALSLTTAEYELIKYMMQNAGRLVTRDELYQSLRGIEYDGLDRAIDMRISALRQKMNDSVAPFRYIKTVRGQGYLLAR